MAESKIDELRRRLEREPRLFAQLAEELRKSGELAEAIRVSREGLQRQPAYASARLTLGRALLDSGALAEAKAELEAVLKTAPDNILAGRLLGECLEDLGDFDGALRRFQVSLAMAPGDKQLVAHIQALEAKQLGPGPQPAAAGAAQIEAGLSREAPPPAPQSEPSAIALVDADEDFELEAAYAAPSTRVGLGEASSPAEPTALVAPQPDAPPLAEFVDLEAVRGAAPDPTPVRALLHEETLGLGDFAQGTAAPLAPPAPERVAAGELASATLAELYWAQGHADKAVEVYQQVVGAEPENARARDRLAELLGQERAPVALGPSDLPVPGVAAGETRRQAIERTIGRLEDLLEATRRPPVP